MREGWREGREGRRKGGRKEGGKEEKGGEEVREGGRKGTGKVILTYTYTKLILCQYTVLLFLKNVVCRQTIHITLNTYLSKSEV